MIPKYPFEVRVTYRIGAETKKQSKSFELVGAAVAYMAAESRRPLVKRVELIAILEDISLGT